MKHIHAEKMMEYAQDAMETDEPWERWEFCTKVNPDWPTLGSHPSWSTDVGYRRKPRTIKINGHEVPEPVQEPLKENDRYYLPELTAVDLWAQSKWRGDVSDAQWLKSGVIHLTQEAAIAHAKALLSFTEKQA